MIISATHLVEGKEGMNGQFCMGLPIFRRKIEYLGVFLKNLLLNENNELHNRNLHISVLPEKGKYKFKKQME